MKLGAKLTAKQRRAVLEYAGRLAELAAEAPNDDAKRRVYVAVNVLRKTYGYSEQEKRQVILDKIELGASSIADLIKETGFAQPDVHRLTKELEEAGLIKLQKISHSGNGRPALLFFPVEI